MSPLARSLAVALPLGVAARAGAVRPDGDVDRIHAPAVVRGPDGWYLVASGEGIPTWWSPDLRTWTRKGNLPPYARPRWVLDAIAGGSFAWAPDLAWWGGRRHLYYSNSTFASQASVMGLLTSPALGEGATWLAWGSFRDGIHLQQRDPATGKRTAGAPVHGLATCKPWRATCAARHGVVRRWPDARPVEVARRADPHRPARSLDQVGLGRRAPDRRRSDPRRGARHERTALARGARGLRRVPTASCGVSGLLIPPR